jgi:hypothetical protein
MDTLTTDISAKGKQREESLSLSNITSDLDNIICALEVFFTLAIPI